VPVINPDATAILIWLQEGFTPTDSDFSSAQTWTLEEAVNQAYEAAKDHDKRPWIKSDDRILDQNQIGQIKSGLRAMGLHRAKRS
jgi:hypothetical protein